MTAGRDYSLAAGMGRGHSSCSSGHSSSHNSPPFWDWRHGGRVAFND